MINFNKNFDAAQFGGLSEKIVCTCHTCQTFRIKLCYVRVTSTVTINGIQNMDVKRKTKLFLIILDMVVLKYMFGHTNPQYYNCWAIEVFDN